MVQLWRSDSNGRRVSRPAIIKICNSCCIPDKRGAGAPRSTGSRKAAASHRTPKEASGFASRCTAQHLGSGQHAPRFRVLDRRWIGLIADQKRETFLSRDWRSWIFDLRPDRASAQSPQSSRSRRSEYLDSVSDAFATGLSALTGRNFLTTIKATAAPAIRKTTGSE